MDLAVLVHDAVADARATSPERSIGLDAGEPAVVSGDSHLLHQVLANLIRNALVHTPAGTAIEVSVTQDDDAVSVTVRDHGPGLPAASREDIFDRFWRSEGGRERGKAGAGLGLSIVREIVVSHGGTVSAADASDGGAVFIVRLPKSPAAAA